MFYKAIVECGHMGAGNSFEKIWFINGRDPIAVLERAKRFPRVKRKETSLAIKMIKRITREEYLDGIASKQRFSISRVNYQ